MKQTLEEAARKYADEIYDPADRGILYRETQDDFIAGAKWQAKQSPWISVKERLPEHLYRLGLRGLVNHRFVAWVMGFPIDHLNCMANLD